VEGALIPPAIVSSAVKRDRVILLTGLAVVAGVGWVHMAGYGSGGALACHGMASGPRPWAGAELAAATAMWIVMMVAMMLPIVSPWVLALTRTARQRNPRITPFPEVGGFLVGYAAVWTGYSVLAAGGQLVLQRAALLTGEGALTNRFVAATVLAVAGAYQWTPFRDACMAHCRSPFAFFLSSWRGGPWGAFSMGARHGIYCAGCCWALMGLSFVFGVMSLAWMAALTAFLVVEKVISAGPWLGRASGVLLVGGAAWVLVRGL
jgi:predicted metal-binding membrane protein